MTIFFSILLGLIVILIAFLNLSPQFGASLNSRLKERYRKSKNWQNNIFVNALETNMDVGFKDAPKLLYKQFTGRKHRRPAQNLPVTPFHSDQWQSEPNLPKFIWFGHSAVLLQLNGKNIFIDPMMGKYAAPIPASSSKRFSAGILDVIDDLPAIDAVLLTHDHYDHLDLPSIRKLKDKTDKWITALGVGRHLQSWGIPENKITELDWWEETLFEDIRIVFTTSRHFSGRGLTDRAQSLWGGFVLKSKKHSIYWTGDGGYGKHFAEIGQKYGPFDWCFTENGQYNEMWSEIHMFPNESAMAAADSNSRIAIPVHWAGFALAMHHWKEPIEQFTNTANKLNIQYCTPRIGEIVKMSKEPAPQKWYADFE